MKPFTYRGHEFYLSSTTTTVRQRGREVVRWIIACDGPYGWWAGFNDRPTTIAEAKEHLRYLMGGGEYATKGRCRVSRIQPSKIENCEFSRHNGQWHCFGRSHLAPMDCWGLGDTREAAYAEYRKEFEAELEHDQADRREDREIDRILYPTPD